MIAPTRLFTSVSHSAISTKVGKPEELRPYYDSIRRFQRHDLDTTTFINCYPEILKASDKRELYGLGEVDPDAYELFANHFFLLEKENQEYPNAGINSGRFTFLFAKLTEEGASYEELATCTKYCTPIAIAPNELLQDLVTYYEDQIASITKASEEKAALLEDKIKDLLKEYGLGRFIVSSEEPGSFATFISNHCSFHAGFIGGSYLAQLLARLL